MKTGLATAALLFVVACGAAFAQAYQIRVTHATNLRASHSLDSAVLASAAAGSTLQVVDHYESWLKIDRDGATAWMADWVDYTRLEPTDFQPINVDANARPSGSSIGIDIDNCCYLDRECTTDAEWEAGKLAFQNNLCHADQSLSCCDRGWICTFDFDFITGKWFWRHNGFCSSPAMSAYDGVIIEGSNIFIQRVRKALDRIRSKSPEWHAYAISGALKIREVSTRRSLGGSSAPARSINLGVRHASSEDSAIAAIVHESCHVQRMLAGLRDELEWRAEEAVCDTVTINALAAIAPGSQYMRHDYPRYRINEFLELGLDYDVEASAQREWERARQIYSTRA